MIRIIALNFSSLNSKFFLIMMRKYEPDVNPSGDGFILFPYTMDHSSFNRVITHAQHKTLAKLLREGHFVDEIMGSPQPQK
jgi:hypothetical protein